MSSPQDSYFSESMHDKVLSCILQQLAYIDDDCQVISSELVDVDSRENPIFEYLLKNGDSVEFPDKYCFEMKHRYLTNIFKNGYSYGEKKYYIAPIDMNNKDFHKWRPDITFIDEETHQNVMERFSHYENLFKKVVGLIKDKSLKSKNRRKNRDLYLCACSIQKNFNMFYVHDVNSYKVFMDNTYSWDKKVISEVVATLPDSEKEMLFYQ